MKNSTIEIEKGGERIEIPCREVHSLIIGSGAAGLNAAVQLDASGIEDVLIVSEGLKMGTSINTGSDKQTYYKIGMYGEDNDSPVALSKSFFDGGSIHGDLALVEAALSGRAFLNLVNLGVPFPRDKYGQFVGYKTDHDPLQRATSVGPYTSKEMCLSLIKEVKRRNIEVLEQRVAISLLTSSGRAIGAIFINRNIDKKEDSYEVVLSDNTIFAVGGPGGLYKTSVYPKCHTGGIGLALLEGAKARNLPESQFGLASTKFRWNVSGTYMQVIPRFISCAEDGKSDEQEFLRPYFDSVGMMNSQIFLKGYQWPFDPRKVEGGSSIIDILVYIETMVKKRRVYLDFRGNCEGFKLEDLSPEAYEYLERSGAFQNTPIGRLLHMNKPAVELYENHSIDITTEPLEVAVCAQHNNGGLAGNIWWESENIQHLFPIGEVSGTHGVYRPGGSALNSGQVAGFRVAEYIANCYQDNSLDFEASKKIASEKLVDIIEWGNNSLKSTIDWKCALDELQERMSTSCAHIRDLDALNSAICEARKQWNQIESIGCKYSGTLGLSQAYNVRQLCFSHLVYLEAIKEYVESGVGSRGSAIVTDPDGIIPHSDLDDKWRFAAEDCSFKEKVFETVVDNNGVTTSSWLQRSEVPVIDAWFETAWSSYRKKEIYAKGIVC